MLPMISHHGEKIDSLGYPDGLSGEENRLTAWVPQIVDVYDQLRRLGLEWPPLITVSSFSEAAPMNRPHSLGLRFCRGSR